MDFSTHEIVKDIDKRKSNINLVVVVGAGVLLKSAKSVIVKRKIGRVTFRRKTGETCGEVNRENSLNEAVDNWLWKVEKMWRKPWKEKGLKNVKLTAR